MTKSIIDLSDVKYRIDEEGMDYTFQHYSHFEEIKDEKFHRLRNAYLDAAEALENYVNKNSNTKEDE